MVPQDARNSEDSKRQEHTLRGGNRCFYPPSRPFENKLTSIHPRLRKDIELPRTPDKPFERRGGTPRSDGQTEEAQGSHYPSVS